MLKPYAKVLVLISLLLSSACLRITPQGSGPGGENWPKDAFAGKVTVEAHGNFVTVKGDCKNCSDTPLADLTAEDGTFILDAEESHSDADEEMEVPIAQGGRVKVPRTVGCRIKLDKTFGNRGEALVSVPAVQSDADGEFTQLMHPNLYEDSAGNVYFGAWPMMWNGRAYGGDAGSFLYVFKWDEDGKSAIDFGTNGVKRIDYANSVPQRIYGHAITETGSGSLLAGGAVLTWTSGSGSFAGDNPVVVRLNQTTGALENFPGTSSPYSIGSTPNYHTQSLTKLADGTIAEYRFSWGGMTQLCFRDATTLAVTRCDNGTLGFNAGGVAGAAWRSNGQFFAPGPRAIGVFSGLPQQGLPDIFAQPVVPNPETPYVLELGRENLTLRQYASNTTLPYFAPLATGQLNPPYRNPKNKFLIPGAATYVNRDTRNLVLASGFTTGLSFGHSTGQGQRNPRSAREGAFLACLEPPTSISDKYFERGFAYHFLDVGASQFLGGFSGGVAMIPAKQNNKFYVAFKGTKNPDASYYVRRYEVRYFTPRGRR